MSFNPVLPGSLISRIHASPSPGQRSALLWPFRRVIRQTAGMAQELANSNSVAHFLVHRVQIINGVATGKSFF